MRLLLALGLILPLAACAGRIADPIEVEQRGDFSLSCEALHAEYEGNMEKTSFLAHREADERAQNLGIAVLGFTLTQWAYVGLDLSDANKREMAALEERRDRLEALIVNRGCHVQHQAPQPYSVYVRERQLYTDAEGRQMTLPVNHFVYSGPGTQRLLAGGGTRRY